MTAPSEPTCEVCRKVESTPFFDESGHPIHIDWAGEHHAALAALRTRLEELRVRILDEIRGHGPDGQASGWSNSWTNGLQDTEYRDMTRHVEALLTEKKEGA